LTAIGVAHTLRDANTGTRTTMAMDPEEAKKRHLAAAHQLDRAANLLSILQTEFEHGDPLRPTATKEDLALSLRAAVRAYATAYEAEYMARIDLAIALDVH
jgi:hypothetical protein